MAKTRKLDAKPAKVSALELSEAPPQPWITQPGTPAGQVDLRRIRSDILDNERRVWVYTPAGYARGGEPYGLLILFDGWAYIHQIATPTILDNLIAAGRIPPMVAVMVDSLESKTRDRELACYPPFVEFVAQELLPWTRERYHITADSALTIAGGSSYGGLAAVFAGLSRPDLFGKVLSQSGSFWWRPDDDPEPEWLARQVIDRPTLALAFYLTVGLREGTKQLVVNRHMRNLLQAKGYPVQYAECDGKHDYLCWQGTLADGLQALAAAQPHSSDD